MSVFVDTSAWLAAGDRNDINNPRGKQLLADSGRLVTTDHVLVETWVLLRNRVGGGAAEQFWDGLRAGVAHVETVIASDLEVAWEIGRAFRDQNFSSWTAQASLSCSV